MKILSPIPSNWKKASAGWHFDHSDRVTDCTDFDRNDYRLHWLRRSLISINLHACQSQLSLCPVTLTGVPGLIWESRKRIQMRFLRLRDTASSPKRRKQKAGRQKAGETTIGFLSTVSLNLISFNRCPFILALSASRSTDKHCWAKYNCTFSKSVWNQWCCANFRKHASTATSSMDLHLCLTSVLFSGWVYAHNCIYAHKCTYT